MTTPAVSSAKAPGARARGVIEPPRDAEPAQNSPGAADRALGPTAPGHRAAARVSEGLDRVGLPRAGTGGPQHARLAEGTAGLPADGCAIGVPPAAANTERAAGRAGDVYAGGDRDADGSRHPVRLRAAARRAGGALPRSLADRSDRWATRIRRRFIPWDTRDGPVRSQAWSESAPLEAVLPRRGRGSAYNAHLAVCVRDRR